MKAPTERERDAQRKRTDRRASRIVEIPRCADRRRRARLERDDIAWLMWYYGEESGTESPYTYQFTEQQRSMAASIRQAAMSGGDQAIAASRGEGKTTLFERLSTKFILTGMIDFLVLLAATGGAGEDILESIKMEFEHNTRLQEDYPEVCVPVLALENTPNRAHYQLVSGWRHDDPRKRFEAANSKFSWCGQEIVFPNVPGSPSAGAIVATRGLDSAVRGLRKKGRRPKLVGIDDPDTEDTARSEEQAKKLEDRIDRAIAMLGGQKHRVGRVMLTTLQNRICVSYRFTDPATKPSWGGKRLRFLVKPPERLDLWEEYVQLKQNDWQQSTTLAHEFYVANRDAMDAGAVVANPNRYVQGELSALQFYYNEVARLGPEAVATELDNDPGEEAGPIESGITAARIQKQVSGFDRGVVPPDCVKITRGIDCRKVALHWVVRGWRSDGTGFTIDYGVHEVQGTTYGTDEGLDVALKKAILDYLDPEREQRIYTNVDGEVRTIDRTLIDAGWRTEAVYAACDEAGLAVLPVMGFGHSSGSVKANFSEQQKATKDRRPGDGFFFSRKGPRWLVCADSDRWKRWEHDRWLTAPGRPGCMTLFGQESERPERLSDDQKGHHSYARHITNEVEVEEPHKGGMRRRWKVKSDNTHWLDASYYADVAAAIEGIRVLQPAAVKQAPQPPAEQKPKPKRNRVQYL